MRLAGIKVVSRQKISRNAELVVVELQKRRLLLGVTDGGSFVARVWRSRLIEGMRVVGIGTVFANESQVT